MELRDYLRILRKGWPLVLAFTVLGVVVGVLLVVTTTKVYQASVQVFVATSSTNNTAALNAGNQFVQAQVQSYQSMATSPSVTGPVIKQFGLDLSNQEFAKKIGTDAPLNKVLINLHVTDHDPHRAAALANAVAKQFNQVVAENSLTTSDGDPVVKLTVIHPATVPDSPIKPNKALDIGLGFVLGLLVGIGVVVLRDVLDNTVKGPQDFDELGVPVLGHVPFDKRAPKTPIAFRADPHGARSESYRQLRTNLQFVNVDQMPRIISITSAVPGEGKTTTALNLSAALAEAGYRVCLIEADLRRPSVAAALGLVPDVGFTTALIGKAPVEAVLQNAGRNLAVLTSGPVPPNPSELLMSEQAGALIADIAKNVDFTIIDSAPLLPVTDGAEIASRADATLLVHHAGKTTREQAARAIDVLDKVDEHPVGVILNMITRGRGNYDYEYGYYYEPYRPNRSRRAGHERPSDPSRRPAPGTTGTEPAEPVAATPAAERSRPAEERSGDEPDEVRWSTPTTNGYDRRGHHAGYPVGDPAPTRDY